MANQAGNRDQHQDAGRQNPRNDDTRQQQQAQDDKRQQGGQQRGGQGNFANDRERASDAGRKGGQS